MQLVCFASSESLVRIGEMVGRESRKASQLLLTIWKACKLLVEYTLTTPTLRGVGCLSVGTCARKLVTGEGSYLVDPASSHMLVSKIKPCMSKYKLLIL